MTTQDSVYVPGLAGVPAAESGISFIDGAAGILEYRGYPIETLAVKSSFEETAWLLYHGALPTTIQLAVFRARLAEHRALPREVREAVQHMPAGGHPMFALQAGIAVLGMASPEVDFHDAGQSFDAFVRILAAAPSLVAAFERARKGRALVEPDPGLSTAANFLWMTNGVKPDDLASRALDAALILHADHTMNASTFTARVVASSEADPYAVCSAAVGSLKGALHGGANERVLEQLEEIGNATAVAHWVDGMLARKEKVMGFGHRVYKTKDPRSKVLQDLVVRVFERLGRTPMYDTALALEQVMLERVGPKGIHPNVDFFSGILYSKLGLPTDQFTPVFGISRCAGWLAHWHEQMRDNKLFRPRQVFTGSRGAKYVPIEDRR